jgi:C-terminal processing protease CtpA/Prc
MELNNGEPNHGELNSTELDSTELDSTELVGIIGQVRTLVETHYLFPDIAATVSGILAAGLADGRYPHAPSALATAVTTDLQSVNGDKHLRLKYHDEAITPRTPGDDTEEYADLARWADQTCGGVACAQRLAGNVGYLDLQPILFPAAFCGEVITAAMSLLATTDALIIDLRNCLGGEPYMAVFLISYLCDRDPVQLTGLRERQHTAPRQMWTLAYVPGRRFGQAKPVYVLTSGTTFSGGEQLSYDLQQLGRATIVGEQTRGGANAREGFTVHPHLEATISVAEAVNPKTGGNWEGTGVTPDIPATSGQARDIAYEHALRDVITAGGTAAAEARDALARVIN